MAWIYILIAGIFETGWAVALKYSEGFSRLFPSVLTFVSMVISLIFLSLGLKQLPLGTAYAVWTGIGTVGTVIVGILFLGDPKDFVRLACILLIVMGIAGLKLTSSP